MLRQTTSPEACSEVAFNGFSVTRILNTDDTTDGFVTGLDVLSIGGHNRPTNGWMSVTGVNVNRETHKKLFCLLLVTALLLHIYLI